MPGGSCPPCERVNTKKPRLEGHSRSLGDISLPSTLLVPKAVQLETGTINTKEPSAEEWTLENANKTYSVSSWGEKYFNINSQGHIEVDPFGKSGDTSVSSSAGVKIDLFNLVEDCIKRGHEPPLLIRFSDIIRDRIANLNQTFDRCMSDNKYDNIYQQVFPLRACPSRSVVDEVMTNNQDKVGLCASSKPELLIVLATLKRRDTLIICTGYKDSEYVETALLAQQLGQIPVIVIEKLYEIDLVLAASTKLGIKPIIGVKSKIISVPLNNASVAASHGKNRYMGFSVDVGDKAKFGLSSTEMMVCVQRLKDNNLLDSLQMLHFNIGSQICNITSIKRALREATQYFVQLCKLGANMRYFDVGGGLAVDYDGSRTSKPMSLNYSVEEYASDVVVTIKDACMKHQLPCPIIVSESGRHATAHHSVVVFNVTDATTVTPLKPSQDGLFSQSADVPEPSSDDHELCIKLYEVLRNIEPSNLQESIHDARQYKDEALALFTLGMLILPDRAKIETLFWCCINDVVMCLKRMKYIPEELEDLKSLLSHTYYCNFSLFQSAPDSWARDFVFPVMPIHRLNEKPDVLATLADLTCDSDGKVASFMSGDRDGGSKELLELHQLDHVNPYYIGMFMTGAYQEILGSMHNLYGDTHILIVEADQEASSGYSIEHVIKGNTIDEVLKSFSYDPSYMLEGIRLQSERALKNKELTLAQYKTFVTHYERALRNYTYLSTDTPGVPTYNLTLDPSLLEEKSDSLGPSQMSRYLFAPNSPASATSSSSSSSSTQGIVKGHLNLDVPPPLSNSNSMNTKSTGVDEDKQSDVNMDD